jgi:AcrR family transcriptional regulator
MLQLEAPAETERADAARNRVRILDAAKEIIACSGVASLTMDGVARAAGLGKGTVFRRFGSRSVLLQTLLNDREMEFQRAFMSGPPPLGPGADPVERLVAFGRARLAMLDEMGELLRAADESSVDPHAAPPRAAAALHIATLLRAAKVQGDVTVLALSLQASIDPLLVQHEHLARGIDMDRLGDAWEDLARRIMANPAPLPESNS